MQACHANFKIEAGSVAFCCQRLFPFLAVQFGLNMTLDEKGKVSFLEKKTSSDRQSHSCDRVLSMTQLMS